MTEYDPISRLNVEKNVVFVDFILRAPEAFGFGSLSLSRQPQSKAHSIRPLVDVICTFAETPDNSASIRQCRGCGR
jgi:hypothetical protein